MLKSFLVVHMPRCATYFFCVISLFAYSTVRSKILNCFAHLHRLCIHVEIVARTSSINLVIYKFGHEARSQRSKPRKELVKIRPKAERNTNPAQQKGKPRCINPSILNAVQIMLLLCIYAFMFTGVDWNLRCMILGTQVLVTRS